MEALSGGLGGLVIDNDLEKPEGDRINIFHQFVKQKIQVHTGVKRKHLSRNSNQHENLAPLGSI